jgi:Cof subfamily protein (haloacid dehalogenase superfamily)
MKAPTLLLAIAVLPLVGCAPAPCPVAPNPPAPTSAAGHVRFAAIYLDMDGTMLGSDDRIRPATLEALAAFRACGGRFGVASGRTLAQMADALPLLEPNLPLVLFNGAVTLTPDGREALDVQRLSPEAARAAVEAAIPLEGAFGVVLHGVSATAYDRESPATAEYLRVSGIADATLGASLPGGEVPVKILVLVTPETTAAVVEALGAALGDQARVVETSPHSVEILRPGVTKASAIFVALEREGIAPSEVLAFGDSGNDVEMLAQLGFGFAMGNCRPAACDAAGARIGGNDTDAIADVITRLALTPACRR